MVSRILSWNFLLFMSGITIMVIAGGYYYQQPKACHIASEGKTAVRVRGLSWDSDSAGFAFVIGLSKEEGAKKAARLNSKIYVDGQPERFVITKSGPEFEIEFETDQQTFRLVSEGEGFPRTISRHYKVPKSGCDVDVARFSAPRGEGSLHTWPLPIVATQMGYKSWKELMSDNNAVIRVLARGSGEEGVPGLANDSLVEAVGVKLSVYPFFMDKKITFLEMEDNRTGAFMVVVPFSADEPADKDVALQIVDTVTEPKWNPPRPWQYDPATVSVRNGFASDIRISPSPDQ
jgi:hypothetical protein